MKQIKRSFLRTTVLALYGFIALVAAAFGPVIAKAQCPCVVVNCNNGTGKSYCCAGTPTGTYCRYDYGCLSGNRCGS